MAQEIFISTNTPSSKNSKQWTGEFLVHSKLVTRWKRLTKHEWIKYKPKFLSMIEGLPKPYFIHLTFVRKSRRKFDYINIAQAVKDEMKHRGWIADDNADEVVTVFGKYSYDKHNPGVYIKVLSKPPQYEFV